MVIIAIWQAPGVGLTQDFGRNCRLERSPEWTQNHILGFQIQRLWKQLSSTSLLQSAF